MGEAFDGFNRILTVPTAGAAVASNSIQLSGRDTPCLPTSIRCAANLRTTTTFKIQVSQDDTTYYDIYSSTSGTPAVISFTETANAVLPIPDVVKAGVIAWAYMRIVTNSSPNADLAFDVHFTAAEDDNPTVLEEAVNGSAGAASAVSISQVTPGTTNGVVIKAPIGGQAPTNSTSTALEASRVGKASPGTLFGLSGFNNKASAQYIQIFDSATVPADAAVPVQVQQVPALSPYSFDFGTYGRGFAAGIAASNSSTLATKTLGSADCWFDFQVA